MTNEERVVIVGVPLPASVREQLIQAGLERGWTFGRSGRANIASTARHILELGLRAEQSKATPQEAAHE